MTVPRCIAAMIALSLVGACNGGSEPRFEVSTAARSDVEPATTTSTMAPTTTTSSPPQRTTTTRPRVRGSWRNMASAPASALGGVEAWTGTEMVVWGRARGAHAEGATYVLSSNAWRDLPLSPLSVRRQFSAVWTGREVVYWGGFADAGGAAVGDGAAYDPASATWRRIPPSPIPAMGGQEAVWTGKEMVVWGGYRTCCAIDSALHDSAAAAYDPATNTWRRLADAPAPLSGDGGRALTMAYDGNVYVYRRGALGVLDMVANEWRALPAPAVPDSTCRSTAGPVVGGALVAGVILIWTGECTTSDGFAFDTRRNEWRGLGPVTVEVGPSTAASADSVFTAQYRYSQQESGQTATLMRYLIADNQWKEIALPPSARGSNPFVAVTGDELIVWGGSSKDGTPLATGAAYAL